MVFGVAGLLVLAVLLARLFTLQVVYSDRARLLSEKNWLRPEAIPGRRGRILDRGGRVLADVVPSYTIVFDPQWESFGRGGDSPDSTLDRLARLLGDDGGDYREELDRRRGRSYHPVRLHRNADLAEVTRVEENRRRLPGVSVVVDSRRYYPNDSLAVHVLGYVNEVNAADLARHPNGPYRAGSLIGRSGVEAEFETELRGRDGMRFVEVNVRGRRSRAFVSADPIPPRPGTDIALTLDLDLQRVLEGALDAAPYSGSGEAPEVKGAAVVMDVRTGDILAMASRPAYDPNVFSRRMSHAEFAVYNRPAQPFWNRAVQGRYPPGSTFKGLTLYAALDEGKVTPEQKLQACVGGYQFGTRWFRCWRAAGHGRVDAYEAMAQSCDVYFYQLGRVLGVDGIARYASLFGLGEKTGIDLPGEKKGLVPDRAWYDANRGRRGWSVGVALNLSIGQGEILLTPLELVQFAGVLATGGERVRPHVLYHGKPGSEEAAPEVTDLGLVPAEVEAVRRGMIRAVRQGTARVVRFPEVAVAAKTGTAETTGPDNAVFIAFAPVEHPEIALAVYLEHRGHGGSAAGPVARKVLASYFGIADSAAPVRVGETD